MDDLLLFKTMAVWRSGSILVSISDVTLHRARLLLGWVTVSMCNQPSRSTQPGHLSVGRRKTRWYIHIRDQRSLRQGDEEHPVYARSGM